jgi:hypothetical protein
MRLIDAIGEKIKVLMKQRIENLSKLFKTRGLKNG